MKIKNQIYEDIKFIDFTALKILFSAIALSLAWVVNEASTSPLVKITPVKSAVISQSGSETETPLCPVPYSDKYCRNEFHFFETYSAI